MARILILMLVVLAWVGPARATNNEEVAAEIVKLFESGKADFGSDYVNSRIDDIEAYYATRSFKPVWTRDDGPKSKGGALLVELKRSAAHGLVPELYNAGEIENLLESDDFADLARLDLLLSGAAIEFGNDLRNGRIGPDKQGSGNAVVPIRIDPVEFISEAADAGNYTLLAKTYLNSDKRYVRLIGKLAEMQRMQASGQWPAIDSGRPVVDQLDAIARLLVLNGDTLPGSVGSGNRSIDDLAPGIRSFQERHDLPETGEIDAETLEEMAVPISHRIDQIRINLERRRWQNRPIEANSLYLSLTDQVVRLLIDGETVGFPEVVNGEDLVSIPSLYGTTGAVTKAENRTVVEIMPEAAEDSARQVADFTIELSGDWPVAEGMQVYVAYITSWVTRDGKLHHRKDRLGRNDVLIGLMQYD